MVEAYICVAVLGIVAIVFMCMTAHYSNKEIELRQKLQDVKVAYLFAEARCKDVAERYANKENMVDYENKELRLIINTLMSNLEKTLYANKD